MKQQIKELVSSMSDEELNSLSPEEFDKMHSILSAPDEEAAPAAPAVAEAPITPQESAFHGAVKGFTQNFDDEVKAGFETLVDIAGPDHTWSEKSALYTKNASAQRELDDKRAEANSKSFLGGQVAGGIASLLVVPGASAFASSVKGAAVLGGVAGYGDSTGLGDSWKIPFGAVVGGGATKIGNAVAGKLAGSVEKVAAYGDELAAAANTRFIKLSQLLGYKGVGYDSLLEGIKKYKSSPEEFASDIVSNINITKNMTKGELSQAMEVGQQQIWGKVSSIHQAIDSVQPLGIINKRDLLSEIVDNTDRSLSLIDPQVRTTLLTNLQSRLGSNLDSPLLTLQQAQTIKGKVADLFDASSDPAVKSAGTAAVRAITIAQRDAVSTLPDTVNAAVPEMVDIMGQKLTGLPLYQAHMRQYSSFENGSGFIKHAANQEAIELTRYGDSVVDLKFKVGQLATGKWRDFGGDMLRPGAVFSKTGLVGEVADLIKGSSSNLRNIRNFNSADRVYNALKENPARYSKHVSNMILGASKGADQFVKAYGFLDATISLENVPVRNEYAHILEKAPDLINVINQQDPNLGAQFQDAIMSNDQGKVGSIVGALKALPEVSHFFEAGLGMDGKIYSALDRSKALTLIEEKRKGGWTNTQVMQAKRAITQYNSVPQFEAPAIPPLSLKNIAAKRINGKKEHKL